jgi:omega-6 fatty acid desaturase (delta-12 desaturase)
VHIEFPWVLRLLLHNINEHTAHHINPRVPLYGLKQAQDRVREVLADDVIVLRWSPRVMFDTLRRCKLYDFREHRWLDFAGRPTTEGMKVAVC